VGKQKAYRNDPRVRNRVGETVCIHRECRRSATIRSLDIWNLDEKGIKMQILRNFKSSNLYCILTTFPRVPRHFGYKLQTWRLLEEAPAPSSLLTTNSGNMKQISISGPSSVVRRQHWLYDFHGSPREFGVNPKNIPESKIQHPEPHENRFHYPVTCHLESILPSTCPSLYCTIPTDCSCNG